MGTYQTGTGQTVVNVHDKDLFCLVHGCAIHNPSDHHMKDWPTNWRADRRLMERVCPHGVGHPDPDTVNYRKVNEGATDDDFIHGCDGCCHES